MSDTEADEMGKLSDQDLEYALLGIVSERLIDPDDEEFEVSDFEVIDEC